MQTTNPAQQMIAFQDFLNKVDREKGGDGLVYVRSLAPKGRQFILEIKDAINNRFTVKIKPGAPVCLTSIGVDVASMRRSADLMGALRAGYIKLMTSAEAAKWFEDKAEAMGISVDELVAREAQKESKVKEEVDVDEQIKPVDLDDENIVSPRIMNISAKMTGGNPNDRVPEPEIMSELVDYKDAFKRVDFEYLEKHATYAGVKKWATKQLEKLA